MIFFKSFSRYLIELFLAKSILKFLLLRRNRLTVITDMAHSVLHPTLERAQLHWGLAVHPDHEVARVPRLEGGGHDDVAAGGELEPAEHLPQVRAQYFAQHSGKRSLENKLIDAAFKS